MPSRNELNPSEVGKFLAEGYLARNTLDVQRASLATYRLLALGQPVSVNVLAKKLDVPEGEVSTLLDTFPPSVLERDNDGSVIAFIGLSLSPTAHRFVLEGRTLYTWCVLDALFLPELLGERARVATSCPASGEEITLEVAPDRIAASSLPGVVMSVVAPDAEACRDNLRGAFCSQVNLFASADSFALWAKARSGVAYVPLAEAFDLARTRNSERYPDIDLRAYVI